MAEIQPPSWMQNACTTARDDRLIFASLICQDGVGATGDLAVTGTILGSMEVNVFQGGAFIEGDTVALQGVYHVYNDGTVTLPIAAADPTDPRIDIVIARIRDAQYSGTDNDWLLEVITGSPSPAPSPPATPDSSIVLAQVTVPAGATVITNADIDMTVRDEYRICNPTDPDLPRFYKEPGAYTFEKADYPNAIAFCVEVQAAGGGGGGAGAVEPSFGGGGGGGAYMRLVIAAETLTASTVVEVGGGGVGGGAGTAGAAGGDSRFGNRILTGGGGGGSADGDTGRASGGSAGEGDDYTDALRLAGRAGDVGMGLAPGTTTNGSAMGGGGGDSHLGHGGRFQVVTGGILSLAGATATRYGGGGGGAVKSGGGVAGGGDGARGIVIITPIN